MKRKLTIAALAALLILSACRVAWTINLNFAASLISNFVEAMLVFSSAGLFLVALPLDICYLTWRRKRMAKKKHRKLLRKTRHQRRNKK